MSYGEFPVDDWRTKSLREFKKEYDSVDFQMNGFRGNTKYYQDYYGNESESYSEGYFTIGTANEDQYVFESLIFEEEYKFLISKIINFLPLTKFLKFIDLKSFHSVCRITRSAL